VKRIVSEGREVKEAQPGEGVESLRYDSGESVLGLTGWIAALIIENHG
jgi:hypothetical protein